MSNIELSELEDSKNTKKSQNEIQEYTEDNFFGKTRITKEEMEFTSESDDLIVSMKNVHKTYLLGIEGVPALRFLIKLYFEHLQ